MMRFLGDDKVVGYDDDDDVYDGDDDDGDVDDDNDDGSIFSVFLLIQGGNESRHRIR